jgi:pimeloyl-ACP methyl ester carboxylesterase
VRAGVPVHETTVRWHGGEIFVRERGDGHPLLMINGLGANAEMWGPAEERLSAGARTIVFDAPGAGRSSTPFWPQSIPASARLVGGLLDRLGYERVDLLGFSLGGFVAQEFARRAPGRVRRLALAATGCGWGSMPGTPEAMALLAMPLRYYSRTLSEQTNLLLSAADRKLMKRLPALTAARLRYPPSLLGYMSQLYAGLAWSSLPWLSTLNVPTLVVQGEADHFVPAANAFQLARLLPRSRLHVLRDEGHFIVFDPEGGAHPLLEDFVSTETLDDSSAWSSGAWIDDDETVAAAFLDSIGAQPYAALSDAFRWFVSAAGRNGRNGSNGSYSDASSPRSRSRT